MKCQFCNNSKEKKKLRVSSEIFEKEFSYSVCAGCGSIFQDPLPSSEEILEYYRDYHQIKKKINPGYLEEQQLKSLFAERDKTLSEIRFDKSWLLNSNSVEFGCANGHFLHYLKANGAVDITGIDMSKNLLESIKIDGVNLIEASDLNCLDAFSVDNLFLFNIIEHLPDVNLLFKQIGNIIKPSAKIVIETPVAGLVSSFFGNKWRHLMPVEHLSIPSLDGMKLLLRDYSLEIIRITRFGSGFTAGSVNPRIKKSLDFFAKKFSFGDRMTILAVNS